MPAGRCCRVNEGWDVPNEHGIEWCSNQHADNSEPHFHSVLGRPTAKPNAEHVWEGLEDRPGILGAYCCILCMQEQNVSLYWTHNYHILCRHNIQYRLCMMLILINYNNLQTPVVPYLQIVDGHPWIAGEPLNERHQELDTAIPMGK